jgi:hypothetical protein
MLKPSTKVFCSLNVFRENYKIYTFIFASERREKVVCAFFDDKRGVWRTFLEHLKHLEGVF